MSPLSNKSLALIQKYFASELSELEQKEFDKALEQPDFRAEVALQAQVFEGIVASRREQFHNIINDAKDELEKTRNKEEVKASKSKSKIIRLLAIASAMLILVCSLYYFYENGNSDYDAIYAEYYSPYDTPESQRGSNEIKDSPLDKAMLLYENEEFTEALTIINSVNPKSEDIELLMANCYLNIDQLENAENVLKLLSVSNDIKIKQHAEWYLALSYIKSKKLNLAQNLFNKIKSTPNHLYQNRVIKLIEEYGI